MNKNSLVRIVIFAIFAGAWITCTAQAKVETEHKRAAFDAQMNVERAQIKANYKKAAERIAETEAAVFKTNGCTKDARLSNRVLLRVEADGSTFDPYALRMVSFDEGFKAAKNGAWVVGFCN